MQTLLTLTLTALIASSCVSPIARFKTMLSCTTYIEKSKAYCYCAKYDLNLVKNIEDYKEYPVSYCHKMIGFVLADFIGEFEITNKEIQQWYDKEIQPLSNALKNKDKKTLKKLLKK